MDKPEMNEEELKQRLTPEEYKILREGGTEAPFSGQFLKADKKGMFTCKVCGTPLFSSETHEDADKNPPGLQGWPTFNNALPGAVELKEDNSMGMHRTEVVCATCGSHLGHLFDDPSTKTGKHYCLNSVCLDLKEE